MKMEELPEFAHVIDELNKECSAVEEENKQLKKELARWNKFKMPRIKVKTPDEYFAYDVKVQDFMKLSKMILLKSGNFMDLIDISDYSNGEFMMNNITQISIIHDEQGAVGTMPLLGMSITALCFSCISGIFLSAANIVR